MAVHEKGEKGKKDRMKLVADYQRIVKFFKLAPVSDVEIARMGNQLLYKLITDVFDAQPAKLRRKYFDKYHGATNPSLRADPSAFRWTLLAARQNHRLVVAFFIALGVRIMGKVNRVIARVKRFISRVKNGKLLRVVRGWRNAVAEKVEDVKEVAEDAKEKVIDAVDAFKGEAE